MDGRCWPGRRGRTTCVPGADAAASEADWVARWRGGWQLCFPSTGQPDPADATPQGFHGVASQAPWAVVEVADDQVTLRWEDAGAWRRSGRGGSPQDGIEAVDAAPATTGRSPRRIAVAEHLVLGGDVLAPLFAGATLTLEVPEGSTLAPLDYDGRPAGSPVAWPGEPEARWRTVDASTPARVGALVGPDDDGSAPVRAG